MNTYDIIIIGGGASGMMCAITAAKNGKKVLLLEKLSTLGAKLKATGGGRCNLTNTLSKEDFMQSFGKNGRFISDALNAFDKDDLITFFQNIGLETHTLDGFRIFPTTHNSLSVLDTLFKEIKNLHVKVICNCEIEQILTNKERVLGVKTLEGEYLSKHVVIATGGFGYPTLGGSGDGYRFAKELGHTVSTLSPAMMPLHVKENWVAKCRADTIAKATIKVDMPKYKKLKATGDLIFTKNGIRGPVVLDFAREITPILQKHQEVPLLINLTKGLNEEQIRLHVKKEALANPQQSILNIIATLLPISICKEFCKECEIDENITYAKLNPQKRDTLIKLLTWTPLCVVGHDGFKNAMVTRGGVSLKEIEPKSMQSKLVKGLYFCGEVVDIDGPCGGFNLQWAFSSGYLAGCLKEM